MEAKLDRKLSILTVIWPFIDYKTITVGSFKGQILVHKRYHDGLFTANFSREARILPSMVYKLLSIDGPLFIDNIVNGPIWDRIVHYRGELTCH